MSTRPRPPLTPGARTRFQVLTAGLTGLATFGAVGATGVVAGQAAQVFAEDQARKQVEEAASGDQELPAVVRVDRKRPHKIVVRTKVVSAGGGVVVRPGTGGTVRTTSASSGSGSGRSGPSGPAPAPAPVPAPAAPAPSSGS